MIGAWLQRRRQARRDRDKAIMDAADRLTAWHSGDLYLAFWNADGRLRQPDLARKDRVFWAAVRDEIDARQPPRRPRADTATRMAFRDLDL